MKRFLAAVLVAASLSFSAEARQALVSIELGLEGAPEGDALFVYDDGCGVFEPAPDAASIPKLIEDSRTAAVESKARLKGPCRLGLRDGDWHYDDPSNPKMAKYGINYSYGHELWSFGPSMIVDGQGVHPSASVLKTFSSEIVSSRTNTSGGLMPWVSGAEALKWMQPQGLAHVSAYSIAEGQLISISDGRKVKSISVDNVTLPCNYYPQDQVPKAVRCKIDGKNANVPLFAIVTRTNDGNKTTTKYDFCPDPKSSENCSELWNKVSKPPREILDSVKKPTIDKLEAFKPKLAFWEAREQQKLAAAAAAKAKAEEEIRIAAAEKAARQAAERAAAEVRALAEAEQKAAAAEKAAADLRKKLKTAKPGDLYVMAEDAKAAGRTDDAREAFKAILTNHPNSPLAAQAATQLSALGGSVSGGGTAGFPAATDEYGYELSDYEICMNESKKLDKTWNEHPETASLETGEYYRDARKMALWLYKGDMSLRFVQAIPACKDQVEQVKRAYDQMIGYCESAKRDGANSPRSEARQLAATMSCSPSYSGPASIGQRIEAQIAAGAGVKSVAGSSAASPATSPNPPSVCEQKLAAYGQSIAGVSPEPKAPTIDQFRMALWFLDGNLGVLKQHCSNDPKHGPTIAGLQRSRDEAFNSCKQVSTIPDGSACSPLDPRDAKPFDPLAGLPPIPPKK